MIARAASCSPKSGRPLPAVHVQHDAELFAQIPERLVARDPRAAATAEFGGDVRQQDAAEHVACCSLRPTDLGERVVDVVQEDLRETGAPAGRGRAEVGDPTVVRLHAGPPAFVVGRRRLERGEVALREERRDRVREQHLGDDALRLGLLRAGARCPSCGTRSAPADRRTD